ncbi:MAG: Cro/Cl family transcriptional regulator [Gammaproteobacteria bacterium]|nr:Cro/Cl family transcriptional regulator [Gammaproteobacteria bacterium]
MKKKDVIDHFGGVVETAKALGIKSQSVSGWPDDVPELRAFQIEKITGGQLKADFKPAAQLQAS